MTTRELGDEIRRLVDATDLGLVLRAVAQIASNDLPDAVRSVETRVALNKIAIGIERDLAIRSRTT